jgi:hypothetical protein
MIDKNMMIDILAKKLFNSVMVVYIPLSIINVLLAEFTTLYNASPRYLVFATISTFIGSAIAGANIHTSAYRNKLNRAEKAQIKRIDDEVSEEGSTLFVDVHCRQVTPVEHITVTTTVSNDN